MGRPKGGKNREWSVDDKLKYVNMVLEGTSAYDIERKFGIYHAMVLEWTKRYNELGIDGLQNKRKPGNPLVRYSRRKTLTELEQLEYENMLLRIENERLKKGYTEEDAIIAKSSMRSSK